MASANNVNAQLESFIKQEQQRAMINKMVSKLTDVCWDKCITGSPGTKFSSGESNCLTNCAKRYVEMSILIMQNMQLHNN